MAAAVACLLVAGAVLGALLAFGWTTVGDAGTATPSVANAAYVPPPAPDGSIRRLRGMAEAFGKRY